MPVTIDLESSRGAVIAFTEDETNAIIDGYQSFQAGTSLECQKIKAGLEEIVSELLENSSRASEPDREIYTWSYLSPESYQRALLLEDRMASYCGETSMNDIDMVAEEQAPLTEQATEQLLEQSPVIVAATECPSFPWWKLGLACVGCFGAGYYIGKRAGR